MGINIKLKKILNILLITILILLIIILLKKSGVSIFLSKLINSLFPLLLALVISFINEPIILKFNKFTKRKFSVLIVYFIEVLITGIIIFLVFPSLIDQLVKFFKEVPSIYQNILNILGKNKLDVDIYKTIETYSIEIINTVSSIINLFFNIGIGYVGAFFLSFDYEKFKGFIKNLLIKYKQNEVVIYLSTLIPYIYKYTFCLLIDMGLLWIIAGVSFWIAGLEYPFMFSTIIAICDLIPFVGPIIGGAPAVLVALTNSVQFMIIILVIIIVAQFIEANITKPFIMKNAIELHPLEGLFGFSIGGTLFGFIGAILSPIIIIAIRIFIKLKKEEKI